MEALNTLWLVLHFIGLTMALGSGGAQGAAVRIVPPTTPEGRKLIAALRKSTGIGLAILWVSGGLLVWGKYGGPANLPAAFWIKFGFVVVFTATYLVLLLEARRPGPPRLAPKLGPVAGLLGLGVIVFAAIAFN